MSTMWCYQSPSLYYLPVDVTQHKFRWTKQEHVGVSLPFKLLIGGFVSIGLSRTAVCTTAMAHKWHRLINNIVEMLAYNRKLRAYFQKRAASARATAQQTHGGNYHDDFHKQVSWRLVERHWKLEHLPDLPTGFLEEELTQRGCTNNGSPVLGTNLTFFRSCLLTVHTYHPVLECGQCWCSPGPGVLRL